MSSQNAHNQGAENDDALIAAIRSRIKREALDRFTTPVLAADARDWVAGFAARAAWAEIEDRLGDLEVQLEAAKSANTAVWVAAERASRKGYDLDPDGVLDMLKEDR